jgi:D-glycero-alpha-D-manno-heptose-7-phosphate kinase
LGNECIEALAPTRIDLAGGTVDIWHLYLFHHEALTINAAINLFIHIRVSISMDGLFHIVDRKKNRSYTADTVEALKKKKGFELFGWALQHFIPGTGLKITYDTMAPEGSGLAGSSSLLVALCGALNRLVRTNYSRTRLLDILRDIETQLLRVPAGLQDYYPALWGGVNGIRWDVGGGKKETLDFWVHGLEQWLMLVYTKTSRYSGMNNWNILKRHVEGDKEIRRLLQKIVLVTHMMRDALINGDFRKAGEAMAQEASYRKQLLPGIVTPEINHVEKIARSSGAIASKVCGAGGGGCVLLFLEPQRRDPVQQRLVQEGYEIVPFSISRGGLSLYKGQM